MNPLAPRLLFAFACLLAAPSCELMGGMEGVSVPRLGGRWQTTEGHAVEIKQGGFILEATMLDQAGKQTWTNASGLCSDLVNFEMTFYRSGTKQQTRKATVQSTDQNVATVIDWSPGVTWTRVDDAAQAANASGQRPASQPHQKADPQPK